MFYKIVKRKKKILTVMLGQDVGMKGIEYQHGWKISMHIKWNGRFFEHCTDEKITGSAA